METVDRQTCEAVSARSFVVEVYAPFNRKDLADAVARARAAARAMTLEGTPVRYRRSIVIPEDETCFHVFEGPSAEAVDEVSRRAVLDYERVVEAMPLNETTDPATVECTTAGPLRIGIPPISCGARRSSPARMTPLTASQAQIAELASLGLSNAEIAAKLGFTAAVVGAELSEIYRQMAAAGGEHAGAHAPKRKGECRD